ncbi:MAG: acetyl-CoA carboxylase carboxyltransferase subunit alpha [Vicinamibacteria bacterium]|nr:acetyl-CoA carboxylase carboxyltransferase subunit alpha [Vicinamibacteria bacterium]
MPELDFEAPFAEGLKRLTELRAYRGDPGKEREAAILKAQLDKDRREVYANLTSWQRTLVARHGNRPYTLDYIGALLTDFMEVKGDRRFADDPAIICGFGMFSGRPVCVIGHQKGRDTKAKIHRNFGMPKPEGYRKAMRVMRMAEKFGRPIITFVDTPGAYPGLDAEERGQAEAIAFNLREMAKLTVPVIVTVVGEGGSGGALAIAVGNRVNMLENSVYSVITPEGCASILWRDAAKAPEAAKAMKVAAPDMKALGLIDDIIEEPPGGAHSDHDATFDSVRKVLARQLGELSGKSVKELLDERYDKFRAMGRLGQDLVVS